jgi:hypothetical protein
MLVGLGFGILVLFSAFAASSSATAKTDGAPVDPTAMGSVWAKLDDFGATNIGSPMQVVLRRRSRAFVGHAMMRRAADRTVIDRSVCAGRAAGRRAPNKYARTSGAERRRMGRTLHRGGGEGRRTGQVECRPRGPDCEPDVAAHSVYRRAVAFDSRGLHAGGARCAPADHGRAT